MLGEQSSPTYLKIQRRPGIDAVRTLEPNYDLEETQLIKFTMAEDVGCTRADWCVAELSLDGANRTQACRFVKLRFGAHIMHS